MFRNPNGTVPPRRYYLGAAAALSLLPVFQRPALGQPVKRSRLPAIYDAARQRTIVFGGYDTSPASRNDTWAVNLTDSIRWDSLATAGVPPPRFAHSAIYDPVGGRMVVFGGASGAPPSLNDLWELSLVESPTWTAISPLGVPPPGLQYHSAIYDYLRRHMVVFGGRSGGGKVNDVWVLSLQDPMGWSPRVPSGIRPSAREGHVAVYDPFEDRMIVHAGPPPLDDTWWLWLGDDPRWGKRPLQPWEAPPSARWMHTGVFVPTPPSGRLVVFGGECGALDYNETWTLSFHSPSDVPPDVPDASTLLSLRPPQPNPSSGTTAVQFALPSGGRAHLDVLDITGRRVRVLEEGALSPGTHRAMWDGTDDGGRLLPAGIYFLRLESPNGTFTQKVVRIR